MDEALELADVIVLLVDHTAFKSIDPSLFGERAVIDTKGLWRGCLGRSGR